MLPHRLIPVDEQIIRKSLGIIKSKKYVRPVRPHPDSAFNGSPAVCGISHTIRLRPQGLLYPGGNQLRRGFGQLLFPGSSVLVGQKLNIIMAAELPCPLLIAVVGRIGIPVHRLSLPIFAGNSYRY